MADISGADVIIIEDLGDRSAAAWTTRVRDAKRWHVVVLDDTVNSQLRAGSVITGQFTPTEFRISGQGSNVPDFGGFSRENPLIQWVGGTAQAITFKARFFSEHAFDSTAEEKLEQMQLLRKCMEPMGRPPLLRFFWGSAIPGGMECILESLGDIEFDEIRPDGSIRGVTFSPTFKKYTPPRLERIVISTMERTPVHNVRDGETYEMIAQRQWGDPMLGVALREENPRYPMERWAPKGLADLAAGEQIKIYPKRDLEAIPIRAKSHIFREDDQLSADNRRYFFVKRSKTIGILPRR